MLRGLKYAIDDGESLASRRKTWRAARTTRELAVLSRPILSAEQGLFVIGSCFANEIRAMLERASVDVHPALRDDLPPLFPDAVKVPPAWGPW
ncbi:MAG: hypothetical protein AAFQ51_17270, partial [Pseudomonadota bacterium]